MKARTRNATPVSVCPLSSTPNPPVAGTETSIMNPRNPFERLLPALHDAALDDSRWPAAARLVDEACGATGSSFVVGDDTKVFFAAFYRRGERRPDLERLYYENYFHQDERVPRLLQLREGKLVRVASLFSAAERKTSVTWNEALPLSGTQNGLNVRLRGPHGLRLTWVIADPVKGDWETARIRTIRRLLPHIRNFVHVRQALSGAAALGSSLIDLFDNASLAVIHLDRRGRVALANDRAGALLEQDNGLRQQDGLLRAWQPEDDARLGRLVAAALPPRGTQGAGGAVRVRHPSAGPALTLHVHPVTARQLDFGAPDLGALVLIDNPDTPAGLDADLVGSVLRLTPAESRVAVLLAAGKTVPDIAAQSGRAESSIRTYLKRIHRKLGVSRRAELVRRVLSVPERVGLRHRR